jgi:hypothetical protein
MNSVLDFPMYALHEQVLAHPAWMLHTSSGEVFNMSGDHFYGDVFDYTVEGMVQAYLETCINATATGVVDGCFADRSVSNISDAAVASQPGQWDTAHLNALRELTARIAPGPLIANHAYGYPGLTAAMVETCTPDATGFQELSTTIRSGQLTQCHCGQDTHVDCSESDARFNATVAMFLIAAQPHSYFGCGLWYFNSTSVTTASPLWMPMFDRPLGSPLGDATLDGSRYTRHFATGTWAEWDIQTGLGQVHWSAA